MEIHSKTAMEISVKMAMFIPEYFTTNIFMHMHLFKNQCLKYGLTLSFVALDIVEPGIIFKAGCLRNNKGMNHTCRQY